MFYVYVLKSLVKDIHYIGHTEDLQNRLKQHNAGKTRFTKSAVPWEIIYYEEYPTRNEAITREKFLKSGTGRELLKKLLYK